MSIGYTAARKYCCECNAELAKLFGEPFGSGPNQGRYRCGSCWTLYWADHPECLADDASRRLVAEEAKALQPERKGLEVLFKEGDHAVFLTDRGTLLFDIRPSNGMRDGEYDPERFALLTRALQTIDTKDIQGYQFSARSA